MIDPDPTIADALSGVIAFLAGHVIVVILAVLIVGPYQVLRTILTRIR